jgi:hypothetical protein
MSGTRIGGLKHGKMIQDVEGHARVRVALSKATLKSGVASCYYMCTIFLLLFCPQWHGILTDFIIYNNVGN